MLYEVITERHSNSVGTELCHSKACRTRVKVVAPLLPGLPEGYDYRVIFMERDLDEVLV